VEGVKIKKYGFEDAVRGAGEKWEGKFREGAAGAWFSLL
jgi:hypothetical protein